MTLRRRIFGFIPTSDFNNPGKKSLGDVSDVPRTGAGRVVLLYQYLEALLGRELDERDQENGSDCVGQSTAKGVDILRGVRIKGLGLPGSFVAPACASFIYGGSRVEIGKMRKGYRFRGDGSHVPFACEFIRDFGTLFMQQYPTVDLRTHSWSRSAKWGSTGVPDDLEPIARERCIKAYIPVKSYEEYRGAINNGYPVIIGSSQGFKDQRERDADGFLRPRGTWRHAMVGIAVDDAFSRPGGLIDNSWGPRWVLGPRRHNQPLGSFWVEADVIDSMCRKGEAVAISGFDDFPEKQLDYMMI